VTCPALAALALGDVSEQRAQVIAEETRELRGEDRCAGDLELSGRLTSACYLTCRSPYD